MKKLMNPVLGENLEDLPLRHDLKELECQRALLQKTL